MHAPELQALRRLLFYSAAEAARHLAADEDRPQGVEERTWNRWESGKMPVPDNIAATVYQAVDYWQDARHRVHQAIQGAISAAGFLNQAPQPVPLIWYAEQDDFPGPPVLWRPHLAALAAAHAERRSMCRLVAFDARAFNLWRRVQGAADTEASRLAWAVAHGEDTPPTR